MMADPEFDALLRRSEGETLDFKASSYDLNSDHGKFSLVKDVISMANTPRDEDSFIVIGVKRNVDGSSELLGCQAHADEADLQSQFVERVYPIPRFAYAIVRREGKEFGLLRVPCVRVGPCVPVRDYGDVLRRFQIYFRRGSKNDVAAPEDIGRILSWLKRNVTPRVAYAHSDPAWEVFLREVHQFDRSRHYLLVATRLVPGSMVDLSAIGAVPWAAVFDFDPDSDSSGLLASVKSSLQERRSIHLVTMRDRPTLNLRTGTYWVFARGLTGRETVEIGKWQAWQRTFGTALNEQLVRLASACAPNPLTIVVLCYDPEISRHLRTLLEAALAAFGDLSNSVIVAEDKVPLADLAADVEATPVEMPLHQFCSGLRSTFPSTLQADAGTTSLPSSSGAPLLVSPKDQRWMEEEAEIVALESGLAPPVDRTIGRDFLQGNEISWYELGIHSDVERDVTSKVQRQIKSDLESRKTARINLYHAPGAGGTTVAKRLVWVFHREHPCVMLRSTNPSETADRVAYVTSSTGISMLLAVDGADIAEGQIDELYDQLRARNVPAVILQVVRRFTTPIERPRSFFLKEELSSSEGHRFKSIFEKEQPSSAAELDRLLQQADPRFRTAFYFGLVAFKEGFKGLEPYVAARIGSLTAVQKLILGYAAVAHHYGQKPLPAQAFAETLSIPRSRSVDFNSVFPVGALELLIKLDQGRWRTAHDLVAVEILKQLLWPTSSDRRLWKQNLSQWARDFAQFCRGSGAVSSDELLEVVRRVFVYRDNSELLGTERAGLNQFSQLIDDIPSKEGALEVLRVLTELYPDEAHFWAHLGRFHSLQRRDFPSAVDCIDRAIALQDKDNVLHHMRGMALRQQVYDNIDKEQPLARLVELAKDASTSFGHARELSPDDEHGYISEVQMLLRLLDFAGKKAGSGILTYVTAANADPFLREAFQRAEDLLERVRRNREGEGASPYEESCRAKLDVLYGRHDRALQTWDTLLIRKDIYAPPIRRQLVWTYLARQQRSWYGLEAREIDRIVDLLEQNLREEPQSDTNLRLWVQAVRRAKNAPSTEAVIERVGYWRSNANSLDSVFYSYVFYALQSIEGSALAVDQASRFIEECRNRTRFNRNRTKSIEWLGKGTGITRLVHHSQLGNWDRSKDFWENTSPLERAVGRIARIDAPQSGEIEVQGGLKAFFVPARGNYSRGRSENQAVTFYLGFSYEGLRAWEVRNA